MATKEMLGVIQLPGNWCLICSKLRYYNDTIVKWMVDSTFNKFNQEITENNI